MRYDSINHYLQAGDIFFLNFRHFMFLKNTSLIFNENDILSKIKKKNCFYDL